MDREVGDALKLLLMTEKARRRKRLAIILGIASVVVLVGFAWYVYSGKQAAREMLENAMSARKTGNETLAIELASQLQMRFKDRIGTYDTVQAAVTLELTLRKAVADRVKKERESERIELLEQVNEAGQLFENNQLAQALNIYRKVITHPNGENHRETVRFRLVNTLDEIEFLTGKIEALLLEVPEELHRLEIEELEELEKKARELLEAYEIENIRALEEALKEPEFQELLKKSLKGSPADRFLGLALQITKAEVAAERLTTAIELYREKDEIEKIAQKALAAEAQEDFETALKLYESLEGRNAADVVAVYMAERMQVCREIVEGFEFIALATRERNFEAALTRIRDMEEEYPEMSVWDRIELPFLIRSFPAGAEVHSSEGLEGRTPLPLTYRPVDAVDLEIRLSGFESYEFTLVGTSLGDSLTVMLECQPMWKVKLSGTVDAPPVVHNGVAYAAERPQRTARGHRSRRGPNPVGSEAHQNRSADCAGTSSSERMRSTSSRSKGSYIADP